MTRSLCYYSFFIITIFVSGCAINPVSGKSDFVTISESEEVVQGAKYHQSIIERYGIYDNPELQAYVNRLGQALAAESHRSHLNFHFTVLDSPEINAFALPGGYVYITRGIMAYLNSEAELAGVLGHEIGHVTARHSVRQQSGQFASSLLNVLVAATTGSQSLGQLSSQLSTGIVRGYGRKHELEADKLGAEYLHRVGYNPDSMLEVIAVLKNQELYERALAKKQNRQPNIYHGVFSTHPKNDQRLKTVVGAAKKLSVKKYRSNNETVYLKTIEGMTWGQNIEQGIVVNNRFMHPTLAISIQFPEKWQVSNTPQALVARDHEGGAMVQILPVTIEPKESMTGLLKRQTNNNKLAVIDQKYGASAVTQVSIGNTKQPARLSAIKVDNNQALLIIGTSKKDAFKTLDTQFLKINQSFSRLSAKETTSITSPVLTVIQTGKGDSFQSLAKSSPINYEAESILRLLNGAFPDGHLVAGQRLKIIKNVKN
ncbi:MAG: M48 family metalloprotease [Gammaproteobacteria bacterium]|nr:M48 family metalloprotease [Gammaproteobacteria bacterium]